MTPDPMDAIFTALAHASRRKILDIIRHQGGCSVNHVASHFAISRIAVMKHLRILQDADLVLSKKQGRTRRLYFNAVPIQLIHDRWTTEYSALWASKLTQIKYAVESDPDPHSKKPRKKSPSKKTKTKRTRKKHD